VSKKNVHLTAPEKPKSKPESKAGPTHRMIAENRKSRHRYEVLDSVECGMVLHGSEVKSLRDGKCSLDEAYGRIRNGELWLVGCDIGLYKPACTWNHEPTRMRKMLLHKREFLRLSGKASQKGLTLVPLKMYFNERGIAKCVIGLCRGLKQHDKREVLKKNDAQREIQRAMRRK
jgi:SsrA-binding protein